MDDIEDLSQSDNERGTIEAGLVIIPTTILFLMILQIIFAGSFQIIERTKLHNLVIESSLADFSGKSVEPYENGVVRKRFLERADEVFTSNTQIKVVSKSMNEGQLNRIELITHIPILEGIFNFFGVRDIGVRNIAVQIEN